MRISPVLLSAAVVAGIILSASTAAGAADDPVVYCHDAARDLVTTTLVGDCEGEIVSAAEAEAIKEARRRRIMQSMKPNAAPVAPNRKLASIGTGFFVAEDGTVLTNAHVVDGCEALTVEMTDGRNLPAEVLRTDARYDLALVRADVDPPATVVFRDPALPRQGERADLVGYPNQGIPPIKPFYTDAEVLDSNETLSVPPSHFLISGDVRQGNSGGPVLDGAGMVLGVIFAKADTPKIFEETGKLIRNVGIAVRNAIVFDFLDRYGVDPDRRGDGETLPRTGVFDAAQGFIVRIGCWK